MACARVPSLDVDQAAGSLAQVLHQSGSGPLHAREVLGAVALTSANAALLDAKPGQPAFRLEREVFDEQDAAGNMAFAPCADTTCALTSSLPRRTTIRFATNSLGADKGCLKPRMPVLSCDFAASPTRTNSPLTYLDDSL